MTRYKLVFAVHGRPDEYVIEDPEIVDGCVVGQYFRRPLPRTRMCRVRDVVSLTVMEGEE